MTITLAQLIGEVLADEGYFKSGTSLGEKIHCNNCEWSWNVVDGGTDLYICHKCGHDNTPPEVKDFRKMQDKVRTPDDWEQRDYNIYDENFKDGKKKGKSRPGRVKKSGASCKGSVSSLRAKAKKYGGEKGKMYHWCANMKGGKKK